MRRRLLPILFAMCFSAGPVLAHPGMEVTDTPGKPAADKPPAKLPAHDLTPQVLYQFLLAEIAGQRGNVALAVDAYSDLARSTRDPRIAQRATQIAVFARRYDAAIEVARLWVELDPASTLAQQTVTSLLTTAARPADLAQFVARQLAAEGPNLPAALMQLNRGLSRMPDKRQAQSIVDQVTKPYEGLPEAHFARALAAHLAQDGNHALAEAERALSLRPGWTPAALLRSQLQPRPVAIETLRRFGAEHGVTGEIRQTLARLLVGERRFAEARQEFAEVLSSAPDDADALYAIGVLSYQLGDAAAAERHFRRLLELNFADASSVRLYLGQITEEDKRWDEAMRWYAEVPPGEQFLSAQLRQAAVVAKRGTLDEARRHLQMARATHPEYAVKLLAGEAQLLREAGRTAEALAVLDEGLAAEPDQIELLYESALVAERLGRLEVFEQRLRRLLEKKPDHAHAYNALGYSLAERNVRLDEAQQLIDKAVALAPDDPFILDSRGWVLFRRGEPLAALDALQRAFAMRADPEIAAHLGEVLWTLGRKDEAAKTWAEATRITPSNEVLAATVKRLNP